MIFAKKVGKRVKKLLRVSSVIHYYTHTTFNNY